MAMRTKKKASTARPRRTAAQAREAILDVAEAHLVARGPTGIRLQDVAAEVGVSHPTVLHHFGTRQALVEAVCARAIAALHADLVAAIAARPEGERSIAAMLDRVAEVLGPGGHARVVAWLALSDHEPSPEQASIRTVAEAAHALRTERWRRRRVAPSFEDTYFAVLLAALALFADAVVGPMMRGQRDAAEAAATSARFRAWLAKLLAEHLERG